MTTCNRCGKTVGTNDWDIHTCTPKPGLCNDCETVAHCLKHGCIPKVRSTIDMAREAGFDITCDPTAGTPWRTFVEGWEEELKAFEALVRADEQANAFRAGVLYAAKKYAEVSQDRFTGNDVSMFLEMEEAELSDEDIAAIRARGQA